MKINYLIEVFFSSLKDKCISKKDYLHSITVWNVFKMNKMDDYPDLYLKIDVLLLTAVFEKFISAFLEYYRLNPCHYFSSRGLSWNAMLKITGVKVELVSDDCFIPWKRTKEVISYIAKRFSNASNKYMQFYHNGKPSKYITYLDENDFYGWAMRQYLLYSQFKWLNQKEIDNFDVNSIGENIPMRYILEVDLEYLYELLELHNDYLLASVKLENSHNILWNYCSNIANECGIKEGAVNKLIPNVDIESKYVIHYGNLQLYLSLRMKLTKIHRILKFRQSN